jgi:hypothetical protein
MCTGRLTTADLKETHGLKEIPPREGESHPSLNRWLAVLIPTVWT